MMKAAKDTVVRSRMSAKRKEHVGKVLHKLGMTHSEAIGLFYAQIELLKGLPFDVRIHNELTSKVLRGSDAGKNVKFFDSKEEFFKNLDL